MNMFSYYITTHFISSNKYYNSYRNSHSIYQTYPYWLKNYMCFKFATWTFKYSFYIHYHLTAINVNFPIMLILNKINKHLINYKEMYFFFLISRNVFIKCWLLKFENLIIQNLIFCPQEAELIKAIPLAQAKTEDTLFWPWTTNGFYTCKSGYRFLKKESKMRLSVEDEHEKHLRMGIWLLHLPNKVKNFMWRAC